MKKPDCHSCPNKNCFIQRSCSGDDLEQLNQLKTCIVFPARHEFINLGAPVMGIFFVYDGDVKVCKTGIQGKQQIVRFATKGDIIGHRGYGRDNYYPISAVTLVESKICFLKTEQFFEALKRVPELTFNLMMFYAEELDRSENRIKNLAQMSVKTRVADALLLLEETFGLDKGSLNVRLSRQELAEFIGTTEENIIRTLSQFKKDGLIETSGKTIRIIEHSKLTEMVSDYQQFDN